MTGQRGDQRRDRALDLEAQRVRGGGDGRGNARQGRVSFGASPSNVTSIVCALRCRSSASVPCVDQPTVLEDPDPIAQRLDLAQDVR